MKKILLVHGFNGIPKIFEYFKNEFEKLGFEVFLPTFPIAEAITIEGYFEVFDKYKQYFNDDLTIIAHSIGNPMVIKYIAKNDLQVGKYISLAGFADSYYNEGKDVLNEKVKVTVLNDDEKEKAKKLIGTRISVYSNNDHIVPFDVLEKYCTAIDSKPVLIENIGHMGKRSGLEEFPEVVDLVTKS